MRRFSLYQKTVLSCFVNFPSLVSLNIAALNNLNSSILLLASLIVKSSMPLIDTSNAAVKGGIFGDLVSLPGGLGLRAGAGEGIEVRVLEVDERLRSCLPALARWKRNFSLHLA
jgi:hypothetical protein